MISLSVLVKIDLLNILPAGICVNLDLDFYPRNAMQLSSACACDVYHCETGGGGIPSKPLENVNRLPRIGETLERNSVD